MELPNHPNGHDLLVQEKVQDVLSSVEYYLDLTKQELKEIAMNEAEIISLGSLRGETSADDWRGTISPTDRLNSKEVTQEELDRAEENLLPCFVPVGEGAPKRCVDGRTVKGYKDKLASWFGRKLGPQVQGASMGDVMGSRLKSGYKKDATILGDVKALGTALKSRFGLGAHTDNHGDNPDTGCGQLGGAEARTATYLDNRSQTIVSRAKDVYEAAVLPFPTHKVPELVKNAKSLEENKTEYFGDLAKVIPLIREEAPQAVPEQVGQHKEAFVTINLWPGYTFHTDHFNVLTDDNVHSFNLDAWAIIEEHGEDAFFVLADAIATLMQLTKGDLELKLVRPKQELAAAA